MDLDVYHHIGMAIVGSFAFLGWMILAFYLKGPKWQTKTIAIISTIVFSFGILCLSLE